MSEDKVQLCIEASPELAKKLLDAISVEESLEEHQAPVQEETHAEVGNPSEST